MPEFMCIGQWNRFSAKPMKMWHKSIIEIYHSTQWQNKKAKDRKNKQRDKPVSEMFLFLVFRLPWKGVISPLVLTYKRLFTTTKNLGTFAVAEWSVWIELQQLRSKTNKPSWSGVKQFLFNERWCVNSFYMLTIFENVSFGIKFKCKKH